MKPSPPAYPEFKAHLRNFIDLSDAEFAQVLSCFRVRKLRKNQVVVRPGDRVRSTFWVHRGLMVSTYTDQHGKEHIIQFATECCWITDQAAFYQQGRAQFSITAHEPTEVLELSFAEREKVCDAIPAMNTFFRRKANDSFIKQQQRLLTYLSSDANRRFELLQEEYPRLLQRLSKKTLAQYLGVSRETLSRLKK